ncbi:hypothetical protein [Burkholderia phage BCSR52]|uniref:Uncharacterized protein n=1 Tax=Burkholderia phage BCSR52 TaxID=2805748 RepID=A0A889IQ83_9CAUD|nr:hypothetical protein [Burkholderia phage BCSR52]
MAQIDSISPVTVALSRRIHDLRADSRDHAKTVHCRFVRRCVVLVGEALRVDDAGRSRDIMVCRLVSLAVDSLSVPRRFDSCRLVLLLGVVYREIDSLSGFWLTNDKSPHDRGLFLSFICAVRIREKSPSQCHWPSIQASLLALRRPLRVAIRVARFFPASARLTAADEVDV